ncbi:hypothetical protein BC832DRAFT_81909 [Gaertneriomyces semiglobifer]|nr:hypothetical protein BC832DRAFT_81909 [Gaertneriomyces semiglobifer]
MYSEGRQTAFPPDKLETGDPEGPPLSCPPANATISQGSTHALARRTWSHPRSVRRPSHLTSWRLETRKDLRSAASQPLRPSRSSFSSRPTFAEKVNDDLTSVCSRLSCLYLLDL